VFDGAMRNRPVPPGRVRENQRVGIIGVVWPLRGSGLLGGAALFLAMVALLAIVPLGWIAVRRRWGRQAAGPLWPIALFMVLGTSYALVTPPWQMPDEPQHMVHVEVVRRAGLSAVDELLPGGRPTPKVDATLLRVNRSVSASMRQTDADRWLPGGRAALRAGAVPGPPELSHPPLYYLVAASITRPFGSDNVVSRLALLRLLGVVLAATTVWVCGAVGRLLWPGRRLAEVPMVIGLAVPTFVAFAGSVNNDGLAALLGALLIWLLVAGVLERGWISRPVPWVAGIVLLLVAGMLTKRTFFPLILLASVAIAIRLRTRVKLLLAVAVAAEVVAGSIVVGFSHPRLAMWQQQAPAVSYRCHEGRDGGWAICLPGGAPSIRQDLPLARVAKLEDADVDVNLWLRSSSASQTMWLGVHSNSSQILFRSIQATSAWQLVELRAKTPSKLDGLSVEMSSAAGGTVFVDSLRLGTRDAFGNVASGPNAAAAAAGAVRNEIVNGSGETSVSGAPSFLPQSVQRQVDSFVDAVGVLVLEPNRVIESVPLLTKRMGTTFSMFWATVGWQLPPPLFPAPLNWLLGLAVAAGIMGAVVSLMRGHLRGWPGALLFTTAIVMTAAVLFRNVPPDKPEIISGRYLFPGMVGFATVLAAGWGHLWPGDERSFRTLMRYLVPAMHAVFLGLVFVPFLAR
jgi:predicted membrane protein DUF2142